MTEKEMKFFKVVKSYAMSGGFSDVKIKKEFVIAAVERMEEMSRAALRAVDPISEIERPLLAAAIKRLAETLYCSLDKTEQGACDDLIKTFVPVMITIPREVKEGGQK